MMKNAESAEPTETSQIDTRCVLAETRPFAKIQKPMNVDSRKKAISASIASGAPKMSPTKREYWLQFMPNWNSWMIPVTTPTANEISISRPKNRTWRA